MQGSSLDSENPWFRGLDPAPLDSGCLHLTGALWDQQDFLWKNPEVRIRWP